MAVTVDRGVEDEETPLLRSEGPQKSLEPTPLPWLQFSTLFLLQQAEYLTSNTTYPFLPDLVRHIGITDGDEKNVGFYVGMLVAILLVFWNKMVEKPEQQTAYYVAATATVFHCCRLSDHIGRRPVLLAGVLGLCISMGAFGFSTTFSAILMCQLLIGALNGTTGVIKSILLEMTDSTNIAHAWGYYNASWSIAAILGSAIGGSLSRPADQLPSLFGSSAFLKKYPYFLPCTVCSTLLFISWLVGFAILRETVKQPNPPSSDTQGVLLPSSGRVGNGKKDDNSPLPLQEILTYKVILAAINYAALSLVDMAVWAIQPVFLSTPIQDGGLGLTPRAVGTITSIYNILAGLCQIFMFPRAHNSLGSRNLFVLGVFATLPTFVLWPVVNQMARQECIVTVWIALASQIFCTIVTQMAYGAILILISKSPPDHASLGTTVGFCQMGANVVSAISPAIFNTLFSVSIKSGYLGGQLVYLVLIAVAAIALYISFLLPRDGDAREG